MIKETYVTPVIKSEELEAAALGCYGSPDPNTKSWLLEMSNPSFGFCCDG